MQFDPVSRHPMLRTIALLTAVAFMSGCEGPSVAGQNPRPQLVVDRIQDAHAVPLAQTGAPLSLSAFQELDRFLAGAGLRHGDRVGLTVPADRPAQRDAVVRHLLRHGLRPELRAALPAAADRIVVTIDRYIVAAPECQVWTGARESDFGNRPLPTFGCADITNLGLMVADPADLLGSGELGNADGVVAAEAVRRYREGKSKPFVGIATGSQKPALPMMPGQSGRAE